MNNTVDEAIGGYVAAENEIAANSRLRRDDVGEEALDNENLSRRADLSPKASPTDQIQYGLVRDTVMSGCMKVG